MDIKESLSNILMSANERLDKQSSTLIDQLHAIFEQFTKRTLYSVVDYQRRSQEVIQPTDHPSFFQDCVDFILDNECVLSQIDEPHTKQTKERVVDTGNVTAEQTQIPSLKIGLHNEDGSTEVTKIVETGKKEVDTPQSKIKLLRRPSPLKKSLLKSPSTEPKTNWNLAMKSAETAFAILEDMNDTTVNDEVYETESHWEPLILTSNYGNLVSNTKMEDPVNNSSKNGNAAGVSLKKDNFSEISSNYHNKLNRKTSTSFPTVVDHSSCHDKTRKVKVSSVAGSSLNEKKTLNTNNSASPVLITSVSPSALVGLQTNSQSILPPALNDNSNCVKGVDKNRRSSKSTPSRNVSSFSYSDKSSNNKDQVPVHKITNKDAYTPAEVSGIDITLPSSGNFVFGNSLPSQSSHSRIKHPSIPTISLLDSVPLVSSVIDLTKNDGRLVHELITSASSVLVQTPTLNQERKSSEFKKKVMTPDVEIVEDDILSVDTMNTRSTQCKEVLQLFPDADPNYIIEELLKNQHGPEAVNNVCLNLIDNPGYPRCESHNDVQQVPSKKPPSQINYFEEYQRGVNMIYRDEVARQLQNDFRLVSVRDITSIMKYYNYYYAPSYKVLAKAMNEVITSNGNRRRNVDTVTVNMEKGGEVKTVKSKLLKSKRPLSKFIVCKDLQTEIDFVISMNEKAKLDADAEIAWKLNEEEYEVLGENIECLCCYCPHPFENMVQCFDGHLFCKMCLKSYVKEAVYGSGKLTLLCMTGDCEATFPESQLKSALTTEMMEKYQDRVREENLNLANLENLVRCPGCDYAAVLDADMKVFECGNIYCLKTTCRYCKEDWKDHVGIPCNELEKKDEATLRKQYEEKMTAAKVRTCHKCKSQFMKEDGCNKMTCRCKATMCYICRAPNISYKHFCNHARVPGKTCTQCKACSIWSNSDEDDRRAVAELQQEAQQKRREMGFLEKKEIGAPDALEPPKKKAKKT